MDNSCACAGEEHAPDCPLFAAGVIEFFLRSLVEYWPCVVCGQHRGTSLASWCHACGEKARAIETVVAFLARMASPRAPLPQHLSFGARTGKRLLKKQQLAATRLVATFLRRLNNM
jgi:hypothetical protein